VSWEISKRNYAVLRDDGALDVYCDTPAALAERMAALAGAGPGVRVLEPSAGRGAIARVLQGLGAEVHCVELGSDMAGALAAEGFSVECADFRDVRPDPVYRAVVMNPPFGEGRDAEHVRHAARFLAAGGLLVSTLSRATAEDEGFRGMLEGMDPVLAVFHEEGLPAETFTVMGTGVPAHLIGIRRG